MNVGEMIELFRNFVSEEVDSEDKRETAVYWKSDRIIQLLNVGQIYCQEKLSSNNQSYFTKLYEPTTSADRYLLPEDFLRAVEVKVNCSSTGAETFVEPIDIASANNIAYINRYYYYFDSNYIVFQETVLNMKMKYIKKLPTLKNRLDTSQIPEQYHEWMVMYAVLAATQIDEAFNLSQIFESRFRRLELETLNFGSQRQAQQSKFVHADAFYYN